MAEQIAASTLGPRGCGDSQYKHSPASFDVDKSVFKNFTFEASPFEDEAAE